MVFHVRNDADIDLEPLGALLCVASELAHTVEKAMQKAVPSALVAAVL